jgi:hypothetical protein
VIIVRKVYSSRTRQDSLACSPFASINYYSQ